MRILLVPNTHNPTAVAKAVELVAWLSGQGLEPAMVRADAEATDLSSIGVAPNELGDPSLAVALGGDGTILKTFHLLGEYDVPILGVKLGRLGFLAGTSVEHARDAITSALSGDACVERRATLTAEVFMEGRSAGRYRSLNEVVVSRASASRVIAIDVAIDGRGICGFRADGVVVATATGSTAYALSAGGPIVAPSHGGMVVLPVAPHTLQGRAIVTGPSDIVELSLPDPTRSDACIIVDGDSVPCRRSLDRVVVSRGEYDVSLVKHDGRDFYETISSEFFGG